MALIGLNFVVSFGYITRQIAKLTGTRNLFYNLLNLSRQKFITPDDIVANADTMGRVHKLDWLPTKTGQDKLGAGIKDRTNYVQQIVRRSSFCSFGFPGFCCMHFGHISPTQNNKSAIRGIYKHFALVNSGEICMCLYIEGFKFSL